MNLPKAYATGVRKEKIDMTLSVNPLGCSPVALTALRKLNIPKISNYPDASGLIRKISQVYTLPRESILLGNGSEQLISLVCQAFLTKPGETVLVERGSFVLFTRESLLRGGRVRFFARNGVPKRKIPPKLMFLANPTTPGGEKRSCREIIRVITSAAPQIAVVDEANGEFLDETMISEIADMKNLLVLRTFSKALGLAGLRVGMVFGSPKLVTILAEFQQPFAVSVPALTAAAAALDDTRFLKKTIEFVDRERSFLSRELTKRGFSVSDSVTNNIFVMSPDASEIIPMLLKRGVSVIDGRFFPGNSEPGFRISIKDKRTNREFLKRLDNVLACNRSKSLLPSKEVL